MALSWLEAIRAWRRAKPRQLKWGGAPHYPWYIRICGNFGAGCPLPESKGRPRRLRLAKHHGLQIVTWQGARWVVTRQLAGHSTVNKEAIFLE